ncbi:MAG: galactose oxidase [Planctomycetes bacterium]|nr:galactose oxidase [Planctomycetota bacterium]
MPRRTSIVSLSRALSVVGVLVASEVPRGLGQDWLLEAEHAAWRARDSSAEVVFDDRIWILGGWFDSFQPAPRDVWSSADGRHWNQVAAEAPWKHGDFLMGVAHNGRMWAMGGWYNGRLPDHSASNAVWASSDGARWDQVVAAAPWTPRLAGGLVSHGGKIWLLGGTEDYYFGNDQSVRNDVWCSENGRDWTLAVEHAPWSPRAYHAAVSHAGKIWVLGGGNYVPNYRALNDVWCSEDGVAWTRVAESAGWAPRIWFSSVSYRDRLWVLGGWSNGPPRNWNDVWYSRDGADWKRYASPTIWKERHEHSAFVFRDRIWIAGGHAQPLSNEVWSLFIPPSRPLP